MRLLVRRRSWAQRRQRRPRGGVRPCLECLEDRTLPAMITWVNPAGGDWNNPTNWKPQEVPGPDDEAVINAPGSVITLGPTKTTVGSLDLEEGTLAVGDRLTVSQKLTWSGGTLKGPGVVDSEGLLSITGSEGKDLDAARLDNFGWADWKGGDVAAAGGAVFINEGFFAADTAARFDPEFANDGLFEVDRSGATLRFLDNTRHLHLHGHDLHTHAFVQWNGLTALDGGTLASQHRVDIWGGTLEGPGTIQADLLNADRVRSGDGTLTVDGNYDQTSRGRLDALLGPTPADSPLPLQVYGTADLGGALAVSFDGGFHSRPPATFEVLTADAVAGRFDSVEGLPGGVHIAYTANSVLLQQPLPPSPPHPPPPSPPDDFLTGDDPAGIHDVATELEGDLVDLKVILPVSEPLMLALVLEINPVVVTAVPQQPAALRLENASAPSGGAGTGYTAAQAPAATGAGGTEEAAPVAFQNAVDPRLLAPPDLDPPPLEEMLSADDIAGALLTGSRPRADVLPQKGSAVASVATLLADEGAAPGGAPPRAEESGDLQRLLIDLTAPAGAPPSEAPPGLRPLVILAAGALGLGDRPKRNKFAPQIR